MSDLGPVLERIRDRFVPPEGAFDRLVARRARKRRNQRAGAAVVALILFGGTVAGLWSAARLASTPPASSPGALPGHALDVAAGDGSVWVLTCDRRCDDDGRRSEGSLVRIDPTTRRAEASVAVSRPHTLAVGEGGVWVVDFWGGAVTRFDPETLRPAATIELTLPYEVAPGDRAFLPLHVATGEGAVWVSTARGAVARIDPARNRVSRVIELSPALTYDVAVGEGAVWVGEVPGVRRIDPETGEVTESLDLGVQPNAVLVAGGSVWVDGLEVTWGGPAEGYRWAGGRVLLRLDPSTGRVRLRIPLPPLARVAVGDGVAWVADAEGTLEAFGSDDGQAIGAPLPSAGGILAPDGGAVWVANGQHVWKVELCPTGPCMEPQTSLSPSPSPSPPPVRFVPETYREADRVVLPVTFPDGSTAELVYPPRVRIAELGVLVSGSGSIPGFARDFWIFYGPLEQVLSRFGEPELVAEYPDGLGGTVGFWHLPVDDQVDYLAFQFDSWTVLVYDYGPGGAGPRMSDADRALWAMNFRGRETPDGFLVLEGIPPLRLASAGEHAGPSLAFGEVDQRWLDLFPGECRAHLEGEGGVDEIEVVNRRVVSRGSNGNDANFCLPEASMVVQVYQPPGDAFVDAVLHGLEIRKVELAS